jgi:prepilin-type N-terminal cleavage/methylation domain-containing protein
VPVTRLADERGMTLIEMLVAMTIGLLISLAAFGLIDFTMKRSGEISSRVDADQRGRLAMDVITRQLRSQVCLPSGTVPMYNAAGVPTDASNASFFVDLTSDSDASVAPELHTLAYDATNKRIVETDRTAKFGADPTVDPKYTATPKTRVLLTDVRQIPGTPATPIFTYYMVNGTQITNPAAALDDIAAIQIAFRVTPTRARASDPDPRGSVDFTDKIFVRTFDPNATNPSPCV